MNGIDLIRSKRESFPVSELRKMLGVRKTESYWILKHKGLETIKIDGHIRILKTSFQKWYDNQTKYHIIGGPPPGKTLTGMSYSVSDLTELLAVSDTAIYTLLKKGAFETFIVDHRIRITKESFDRWYSEQTRYRMPTERVRDAELTSITYSLPDIRRMLGVHRNTVYSIINSRRYRGSFECVIVAGQKRITKQSFDRWYHSQSYYRMKNEPDLPDESKAIPVSPTVVEPEPVIFFQDKPFYRVEDLQKELGCSKASIYRLIQTGNIIAVKTGGTYLIPASEFRRIIERSQNHGNNQTEE